jgi:hypothetical protein
MEPEARYKHCSILIEEGKRLLILGGINSNTRLGNIYEFSLAKNSWSQIKIEKNAALFKGRYGHSACLYKGYGDNN